MKVDTVAESFEHYRRRVLPAAASQIQIIECRRAFYAATYQMLLNLAMTIGDEQMPEEEGIRHLERLKAECEAFAEAGGVTPWDDPRLALDSNYTTDDADTIRPILQDLGQKVKAATPPGWGFSILMFEHGAGGNLFYLSSSRREDVLNVMREFIAKQTQ